MSLLLYVLAVGCGCAAVVLLLAGFVEYLQVGRWPARSLLDVAYELRLIRARWFLANQWSWPLRDILERVPVIVALLVLTPSSWWLAGRVGRR